MATRVTVRSRARPHVPRLLAAALLAAGLAVMPAATATAQSDASGPQFANALANSSLVHVKTGWRGYVIVPHGLPLWGGMITHGGTYGPYTATTTCSGFVASSTGNIVTAGHCVDSASFEGGKGVILEAEVATWGALTPAQTVVLRNVLRANARVEGFDSGSPVDRTVTVTVPALNRKRFKASVVNVQPFKDGDVAVLNASGLQAPVLPVAPQAPERGDSIVAAGFPGDVADIVDARAPATFNEGTVSGTETVNGAPFTAISARTSAGMSGGPVVNMDGQVVGTVSWAPVGTDTSTDFMTDVASVRGILTGNGISNAPTAADTAYREGVGYYYQSRYHDAVAQFDQALALRPGWTMATDYRRKAVANYPNDVNPPGLPVWVWVGIAAGALLLLGGAGVLGVLLVRRRRKGPSAAGTPAWPPTTVAPQPGMQAAPPTGMTAPQPATGMRQPVPTAPASPAPSVQGPSSVEPSGTTLLQGEHVFCSHCGARHDAAAHYCETCGQPLPAAMPREEGPG